MPKVMRKTKSRVGLERGIHYPLRLVGTVGGYGGVIRRGGDDSHETFHRMDEKLDDRMTDDIEMMKYCANEAVPLQNQNRNRVEGVASNVGLNLPSARVQLPSWDPGRAGYHQKLACHPYQQSVDMHNHHPDHHRHYLNHHHHQHSSDHHQHYHNQDHHHHQQHQHHDHHHPGHHEHYHNQDHYHHHHQDHHHHHYPDHHPRTFTHSNSFPIVQDFTAFPDDSGSAHYSSYDNSLQSNKLYYESTANPQTNPLLSTVGCRDMRGTQEMGICGWEEGGNSYRVSGSSSGVYLSTPSNSTTYLPPTPETEFPQYSSGYKDLLPPPTPLQHPPPPPPPILPFDCNDPRKDWEGRYDMHTPPIPPEEHTYSPYTGRSNTNMRQSVRSRERGVSSIDNYLRSCVPLAHETPVAAHHQDRADIDASSTPMKEVKELLPLLSNSISISTNQGELLRGCGAVVVTKQVVTDDKKNRWQKLIMLEETPSVMVSLRLVQPGKVQLTRHVIVKHPATASSHPNHRQTQQHHRDATDHRSWKCSSSDDEFSFTSLSSSFASSSYSSPSQAGSYQRSFVCLSDQIHNIRAGEGRFAFDIAFPPLPPADRSTLNEENAATPKAEEKPMAVSSCHVNVCGPSSVVPEFPPCTVPFTTISYSELRGSDSMILLQNTAFDSLFEAKKGKRRHFSHFFIPQSETIQEISPATISHCSSQKVKKLQEAALPAPSSISLNLPQLHLVEAAAIPQNSQVVWTAQHPKISVPSITAADIKEESKDAIAYSDPGNNHCADKSVNSFHGAQLAFPDINKGSESGFHDNTSITYLPAGVVDAYQGEAMISKEHTNLIMTPDSSKDSWLLSDGIDTQNAGADVSLVGENSVDASSSHDGVCYSARNPRSQGQTPVEVTLGNEKGDGLALSSGSLSDYMMERGNTKTLTEISYPTCKSMANCCKETCSEVDEGDTTTEDHKVQDFSSFFPDSEASQVSSASGSTKTSTWLEDDNVNASEFSDLLDSLLDDIESEKTVKCEEEELDGSTLNDDVEVATASIATTTTTTTITVPTTTTTSTTTTSPISTTSTSTATTATHPIITTATIAGTSVTFTEKEEAVKEEQSDKKPTEHTLQDMRRSGCGVEGNDSDVSFKSPSLKKEMGNDLALSIPVTTLPDLHKLTTTTLSTSTSASIPLTVSFRTVPAITGFDFYPLKAQSTLRRPTPVSSHSNGSQMENWGEIGYPRKPTENAFSFSNDQWGTEVLTKCSTVRAHLDSQNVDASTSAGENSKLTLPVGETGISIDIPTYASVNVMSFLPFPSPKANLSQPSPVNEKRAWAAFNGSSPRIKLETPPLPLLSPLPPPPPPPPPLPPPLLLPANPTTTLKISCSPSVKSRKVQQDGETKILLSKTIAKVVSVSSQPDLLTFQSSMLVSPSVSKEPSVVPLVGALMDSNSILAYGSQLSPTQTTFITNKSGTQICLLSASHPHTNVGEVLNLIPHSKATGLSLSTLVHKEQPVVVQIKTCRKTSTDGTSLAFRNIAPRNCKQPEKLPTKSAKIIHQQILKKKSYPDSFESRRVLIKELKEKLPEFSESVLSMLHPPLSAIRRGYITMNELKILHSQAHEIHFNMLCRDHVFPCSIESCPICMSFWRRGMPFWKDKRNLTEGEPVRKQPFNEKKKEGWSTHKTGKEDPCITSSSKALSKGDFFRYKENLLGAQCKRMKGSNSRKVNTHHPQYLLRNRIRTWSGGQVRHSNSESDLLCLSEKAAAPDGEEEEERRQHSADDSCLAASHVHGQSVPHQRGTSSTSLQYLKQSSPPCKGGRGVVSSYSQEANPEPKPQVYTLRSDLWASVCRTTAANLKLKKEIEKGYVAYSEQRLMSSGGCAVEGMTNNSRKWSSRRLYSEPLVMDVLFLNIGTLNTAKEEESFCWPTLHVNFCARKLTYVLSVVQQTAETCSNGHEQREATQHERMDGESKEPTPAEEKRLSDEEHHPSPPPPPPQRKQTLTRDDVFFVVDVPFASLRALNIKGNKVSVVVDALPATCLMAWGGQCWTCLPWCHPIIQPAHNRLSIFRAVLAVSPLHQVFLEQGKACVLEEILTHFSPWFKEALSRPFPICSEHAPSWSLSLPDVPADLSTAAYTNTSSSSSIFPVSFSSSLSSMSSTSSFFSSSSSSSNSSLSSPHTSSMGDVSPFSASTTTTNTTTLCRTPASSSTPQHHSLSLGVNTQPGVRDASPATITSAESYIVSSVRAVLQAKGFVHALPSSLASLHYPPTLCLEKGCSCVGMCRSSGCPCARAGMLCHPREVCCCERCDNPLNVLHVMGFDVPAARLDECLIQNLYSYNVGGLCSVLVSRVRLPCCGASPELQQVIPGTVLCAWCSSPISYSWCSHYVHLQILCPRSHCTKCLRCKPVMNTHCENCGKCTKSTGKEGLCALCGSVKLPK